MLRIPRLLLAAHLGFPRSYIDVSIECMSSIWCISGPLE
jgi:hypothetical protein